MKLWKVYAQCCVVAKGIKKADEEDVYLAIEENINHLLETGNVEIDEDITDIEFDRIHSEVYSKLRIKFEETNVINVGDFKIVKSDEIPDRPNVCGWEVL